MATDSLGDRMKGYEASETDRRFVPLLPIYARIDGRAFSRFTKQFDRPYDNRMAVCMMETMKYLVLHSHATVGYTQSDEISLVWLNNDPEREMWFGGKVFKVLTALSSMATAKFIEQAEQHWSEHVWNTLPTFDARAFQVPNETEAMNAIYWRVRDARKNAVSMAARHHFSHKELQGKNGKSMIEMMKSINVEFSDYPQFFREGSFAKRIFVEEDMTQEDILRIPEHKRENLPAKIIRSKCEMQAWPSLSQLANRTEVLFHNADPLLKHDHQEEKEQPYR